MSILKIHNLMSSGSGRPILFAHGYGCDQNVWRFVASELQDDHEVFSYDYVGCGQSDPKFYDRSRHATLHGHADDLIAVCEAAGLDRPTLVAHSVGTMIGVLAACKRPDLFDSLVLVAPSPSYLNDGDYQGGFEPEDIEALLEGLDSNHFGWSRMMAPVIMGNADRPHLTEELSDNFCRLDAGVAKHFARVTFMADHRTDISKLNTPSLLLQCRDDALAATSVGDYMHRNMSQSTLIQLRATGHCPHMSAPGEVAAAIRAFLRERAQVVNPQALAASY